jgi:hypothetical protein
LDKSAGQITRLLQDHYIKWQAEFFQHDIFYEDGIIDEESYLRANLKVLFIAKEPNGKNHEHLTRRSFCDEWNCGMPTYRFAKRIAEWAAGILNNFPQLDEVLKNDQHQFLRQIAFINVKKHAGEGRLLDIKGFNKYVSPQMPFLKRQINIIAPEIIVLSISHNCELRRLLFPETTWRPSGYAVEVGRANNARVVDFYHPSSRIVPSAAYCLLKCVMQSPVFESL